MVGRRMMATAEPPLLPPFPQTNEGSSPGEASEGDGGQAATLVGIAARRLDVSLPTADPRTTIPGGAIVTQRGRSTPSIAATGGGSPAQQQLR